MAGIGLRYFNYGGLKEADTYEECRYEEQKTLKGAIECKVSLDMAEAELHGDDTLQEQVSVLSKGNITMGVTDDDDEIFADLLGQTVGDSGISQYKKTEDKLLNSEKTYYTFADGKYTEVASPEEADIGTYYEAEMIKDYTSSSEDTPKTIGFGHIVPKMVSGIRKYKVEFFPKVRFKAFIADAKTKGSSLEFTTPSVEGTIIPLQDGTWEKHATFLKEADAKAYLSKLFKKS